MNIIIMGPAGSGKGTISSTIVEKYHLTHISTGDMFRYHISNNTELGQLAQQYTNAGKLVPDEVTIEMLKNRLAQDDVKNGYLLDGFPRTLAQAKAFEVLSKEINQEVDCVLSLVLPLDLLIERITGRRVCPNCGASYHIKNVKPKQDGICDVCGSELIQRKDDTEEKLMVRLSEHDRNTAPVIKYYDSIGLVHEIDASLSINDVNAQVSAVLDSLKHN
mgnify:CR=1 FL=1